jgi:Helix-turn-helix domain
MLQVEHEKWGQSVSDLREGALKAPHPRTRERFLALCEIAAQQGNATALAIKIGRHSQSVQSWVHAYNERGPEALTFRHAGGWPPLSLPRPAR